MAIVTTDDKHYHDIAEALRAGAPIMRGLKPEEMAGFVYSVAEFRQAMGRDEGYSNGRANGYIEGKADGITEGQKAEYDRFWDAYQINGTRTDYDMAFGGYGWTDELFKPKYPITDIKYGYGMFARKCNIKDLSGYKFKVFNAQYMFWISNVEHVGEIEVTDSIYGIFNSASKLKTVDKMIFADTITTWNSPFSGCTNLENITCEGVIKQSISFANSSKLTNASAQSIIDTLKDLTGATAQTLTFHATVGGKLTAEQKATITAKNWTLVY
jgi:hypothetical protein